MEWCKENWEKSVTSRAWGATPYDAGWEGSREHGADLSSSDEFRSLFQEEMAVGGVPGWAAEIVDRMIGPLPACGHYSFPRPLLQICQAIGKEACPKFVFGCYTADHQRKMLMSYYVYCLDAWLKGAPLDIASAELALRDDLGKDWPTIIAAVHHSFGARSELKVLLVRRLVHRLRWWIKTLIWVDDRRDRYMLDVYSGDPRGDEEEWSAYGNSPFGDPYFAELRMPQMRELSGEIREKVPGGKELLERIESTWLCAPKAFRYVERIILEIGSVGSAAAPDAYGTILQCEDTYPDVSSSASWYSSFMSSLSRWLDGDPRAVAGLVGVTPVAHWLVGMLRYKLQLYERWNRFGSLVGARPSGRSGSRTV